MGNARAAGFGVMALCCACCCAVVGWNLWRFHVGLSKIREKDLSFLPSPELAGLLCLGNRNTMAKLRWIDSFAYFEYQLDRHDDRVPGGGQAGGMQRLYQTLITLDPHFQSFYEHAALNTGGVLDQNSVALGFLIQGIGELPAASELWRNAASIMRVYFHWDEQLPLAFIAYLGEWRAAVPAEADQLTTWMIGVGKHVTSGAQQASYWLEQLRQTKAGTPGGDFVEQRLRSEFAHIGIRTLETLANAYRVAHGARPPRLLDLWLDSDLIDPFAPLHPPAAAAAAAEPGALTDLLDPRLVRPRRYPEYLAAIGPLTMAHGGLALRSDPFGLPWRLEGGRVLSMGLERQSYAKLLAHANTQLLERARQQGSWPATLAEVTARGVAVPPPPAGGHLALDGEQLAVTWDPPPSPPWTLR